MGYLLLSFVSLSFTKSVVVVFVKRVLSIGGVGKYTKSEPSFYHLITLNSGG